MLGNLDSASFALDGKSLNELKLAVKQDSTQSMQAVAKQFEAMFMNLVTKSMRGSGSEKSLLDNNETRMYTELLDQQFSQKIAAVKGLGLADMLLKQMRSAQGSDGPDADQTHPTPLPLQKGAGIGLKSFALPGTAQTALPLAVKPGEGQTFHTGTGDTARSNDAGTSTAPGTPQEFVQQLRPYAAAAARDLGVDVKGIMAQAALESGWGKRAIKNADGSPSFNLMGIKANAQWQGKVAEVNTTEYVNGVAQSRVEKFRAYDSYQQAFQDYADTLKNAPRYQGVLNAGAASNFAQGLQKAGYATDPQYAAKLTRIAQGSLLRAVA